MMIFYCCYGRAHSSVAAAALHLGWLRCSEAALAEIIRLPYFDCASREDFGLPLALAQDSRGNQVFILGHGPAREMVERALKSTLEHCGWPWEEILFVRTDQCLNIWTRIGGFLSRRLGLVFPGRTLAAYGIRRSLPCLARCVARARKKSGLDAGATDIG
ncbi:MAG: hypothetical protein PWQ41_462 [Bacillota bacterium]|nr:hypothetical protein [Bacillota bacterium]MDK2855732.1 hypothetical protein [Bacillota bacterium]MDK2924688.1 hypothetical protein [Bacillota bacterium]